MMSRLAVWWRRWVAPVDPLTPEERAGAEVPIAATGAVTHTQAHCDELILHTPGNCVYCDDYLIEQQERLVRGVAFSDTPDEEVQRLGLRPCPSTARRPAEVRDLWPGNRPEGYTL